MIVFMTSLDPAKIRLTPGVRVEAGDGILEHVAVTAVQLQALVDDPAGDLGAEQFHLGCVHRGECAPFVAGPPPCRPSSPGGLHLGVAHSASTNLVFWNPASGLPKTLRSRT